MRKDFGLACFILFVIQGFNDRVPPRGGQSPMRAVRWHERGSHAYAKRFGRQAYLVPIAIGIDLFCPPG